MQRFRFTPDVEEHNPTKAIYEELRGQVREFLQQMLADGLYQPAVDCWVSAASPQFSEALGKQGWLGMTWPTEFGGQARSSIERLVITEELLLAGAPVAAHWIADRQSGNQILKYGKPEQKKQILPRIAAGKCYFAIGMSEAQAGSDLAAVKTTAKRTDTGWRLNGRKLWSTGAHFSHYMIVLARTSAHESSSRHAGLSQFLVDLSLPGIEISGIRDISGTQHFNETLFDQVELGDDALLGNEGEGWQQVMGELSMERSGPERFLSTFVLLQTTISHLQQSGPLPREAHALIGRLAAHLWTLRQMSYSIAKLLEQGERPDTEAALVKELGTRFERDLVDDVRRLLAYADAHSLPASLRALYEESVLKLPSNTLRGGTSEIMRGIIARQLVAEAPNTN